MTWIAWTIISVSAWIVGAVPFAVAAKAAKRKYNDIPIDLDDSGDYAMTILFWPFMLAVSMVIVPILFTAISIKKLTYKLLPDPPLLPEYPKEMEEVELFLSGQEEPTKEKKPPGRVDMRCSVCGHSPEEHNAGRGQCYKCSAAERCLKWVPRTQAAKEANKR